MYVKRDDQYFKTHEFFEHAIANRVEALGNLGQVWSTYESRHAANDDQPFARGVNSILNVRTLRARSEGSCVAESSQRCNDPRR